MKSEVSMIEQKTVFKPTWQQAVVVETVKRKEKCVYGGKSKANNSWQKQTSLVILPGSKPW
jgi:hypothetical protein